MLSRNDLYPIAIQNYRSLMTNDRQNEKKNNLMIFENIQEASYEANLNFNKYIDRYYAIVCSLLLSAMNDFFYVILG